MMNGNDMIVTIVHIGDEVYDKINEIIIVDRLKKIIKELVKRIKQKLSNFDDIFFEYAYENADALHTIVQFHAVNEGGSHRNGKIYIGERGFKNSEMGSDDDIMSTIFHEFLHYIAFKLNIYPKRYENVEEGVIWSTKIKEKDSLDTEEEFYESAYQSFLMSKFNSPNHEIYYEYPDLYINLSKKQQDEVELYIKEKNLKPEIHTRYFQYHASNHALEEIRVHEKTKEVHQLALFTMSNTKLNFYDDEIKRYTNIYNTCLSIEQQYGYTPEGYKR